MKIIVRTLAAFAIDATLATRTEQRNEAIAKFRGALQVVSREGDNADLLKLCELIADSPNVGASDDWWQS